MSYYEAEVVITRPDYKELYLSLFRATERAISALIEAQRAAEEAFINKHGHNDNEGNERKRFFVTSFLRMTNRPVECSTRRFVYGC